MTPPRDRPYPVPARRAQRSARAGAANATGRRASAEMPMSAPTATALPPRAATAKAKAKKSIEAECAAYQARPSTLEKKSVVPNRSEEHTSELQSPMYL